MESLRLIKTYITSSIKSLFTLREKKEYLRNFFKKEELKYKTENGLDFFIIPKQYYLWKGINTNDKKNRNVDIENKDTDVMLETMSSYFFADKNTASLYGTKRSGVDLQFKIVEDIVLLDISSLKTIVNLFRYVKNLTMEDVKSNEYLLHLLTFKTPTFFSLCNSYISLLFFYSYNYFYYMFLLEYFYNMILVLFLLLLLYYYLIQYVINLTSFVILILAY